MYNKINKLITGLLISASALSHSFLTTSAVASDAAWVFAHRVNSMSALNAANNDLSINAIEIDITHRDDVPAEKTCAETWCAYHDGDDVAVNLSEILNAAELSMHIAAVWFDIKSTTKTDADYADIRQTVKTVVGEGDGSMRKFWGVYPATELNTPYVTAIKQNLAQLGGHDENLLIIDVDDNADTEAANAQCAQWGIQCGLSVGGPLIGTFGLIADNNAFDSISGDIQHMENINSIFMWTFNWVGLYEDDMMRLLFGDRSYWEHLAPPQWQCGQEGNGVIVGAMNGLYYDDFCENNSNDDACAVANQSINNGPNTLGTRYTNVSQPRDHYQSTSVYECDKYY
ncbi:hypothetical protein [uncultured Shewanella sp.]|uniref:hypothetical protein n=1 Tax=uncultured Shewanella sp. TaxID=173975 RepID=UPI0026065A42|nr:hypothetical protein [uncultured Shewanella sp.]